MKSKMPKVKMPTVKVKAPKVAQPKIPKVGKSPMKAGSYGDSARFVPHAAADHPGGYRTISKDLDPQDRERNPVGGIDPDKKNAD